MNIAAWLRDLGLERYVQAFQDHDVDEQTLSELTEEDLLEIGVKSVGHRRRLAKAIASLEARSPPAADPAALAAAPTAPAQAEHRQLTVLYCAMNRPTPQASDLHAEDMRVLIQAFHQTCTRVVAEFDGYVANFFGDCVLAYFGWPRAHEDDAERAVRAGLALIHRLGTDQALPSRVGIGTGPVVVGGLPSQGAAHEQSAVGLVPNLAARILGLAAPAQVVIDDPTRQLLAPSFALQPLGRHELKGIAEPVSAYAVLGERPADTRFDARKGPDLPPMIGRDQELGLLLERWTQAQGGEGQAVLLVGEAGIGKSRLARALLDACADQPHEPIRWQCSPYHSDSALWPVIQRLGRNVGLETQDAADAALDKLETLSGPDKEAAALFATLLGLNGTQRYGPLTMTPQMLRERTLELLAEQLFERAEQRPVLLLVEDAHWIDPTTLELIERCLGRIDSERLLMLITSRPDRQPTLAGHPSVTRLSLNRLSRPSMEAIVARLGGARLQPDTRAAIVAQADGVPLFVEELTKAVLETGQATVPASLHGSLMARLDHLAEAKEVAQIAACIGREFDEALLATVAGWRPQETVDALDKLVSAELLFRRDTPPNVRYTFKHALVQDAAYGSLLRDRRRQLHVKILETLEAAPSGSPPEILARHAAGGGLAAKAFDCWRQAGEAALQKSAYHEAVSYFGKAIQQLEGPGGALERRDQEAIVQLRLGQALSATQGFNTTATKQAFYRAADLLTGVQDMRLRVSLFCGLWMAFQTGGQLHKCLALAEEFHARVKDDPNDLGRLIAHRSIGMGLTIMGQHADARAHLEQMLAMYDADRHGEVIALMATEPRIGAMSYLAVTLSLLGFLRQARALVGQARELEAKVTNVNTRGIASFAGSWPLMVCRDTEQVRCTIGVLEAISRDHRLSFLQAAATMLRAWLALEQGQPDEAVGQYSLGFDEYAATGMRLGMPYFTAVGARALAACGHVEQAQGLIEEAIVETGLTAQRWCEPELWRIKAEILLCGPHRDVDQAQRTFEQALQCARAQGSVLLELRAATGLARLWAGQGRQAQAAQLLAPALDAIPEPLEMPDIVEARTLLAELGRQASHSN